MKKIIIFFMLILIGSVASFLIKQASNNDTNHSPADSIMRTTTPSSPSPTNLELTTGQILSNGKCEGEDKPLLTHSPMLDEDFSMITPYGLMIDGHVTPIDHQYFEPTNFNSDADAYPIFAMADATLVDIGTRKSQFGTDEYRLVFSISCKLFYYYDLLTSLSPEIIKEYEKNGQRVKIQVKAGQEIGRIGGQTLDFAVWDTDITLDGFVVAEHYDGEPWKIHTVDPLDYYTDELKEMLLAKYIRTAEPRSGKIDHDIDGTLQGNWFQQGSPSYINNTNIGNYWETHVSFSPNHLDPNGFVISLGNWNGQAEQFGARGNTPLPKDVSQETGLTKYTLTQVNYKTSDGNYWDRSSISTPLTFEAGGYESGCLLTQLIGTRELYIEQFPGKSCDSIKGFTSSIKIYER